MCIRDRNKTRLIAFYRPQLSVQQRFPNCFQEIEKENKIPRNSQTLYGNLLRICPQTYCLSTFLLCVVYIIKSVSYFWKISGKNKMCIEVTLGD